MPALLPINPYGTSNAYGMFVGPDTTGNFQGVVMDNPVELFKIAGGTVSYNETVPMWGGIAIQANLGNPLYNQAAPAPNDVLGNPIQRATTVAAINGWTCYNGLRSAVNYAGSPVPLTGSGNTQLFVRKGANVRIAVACDAALAALELGSVNAPNTLSWDFNNQQLVPYDASTATAAVTSAAWVATTPWTFGGGQGIYTLTVPTANLQFTPTPGSLVNVSGATNAGTAGNSVVNGNFIVDHTTVSGSNTLIALQLSQPPSGTITTIAGTIVINYGTGALTGVQLLKLNIGNSYTVYYNPANGTYTWNRNGNTAVILI